MAVKITALAWRVRNGLFQRLVATTCKIFWLGRRRSPEHLSLPVPLRWMAKKEGQCRVLCTPVQRLPIRCGRKPRKASRQLIQLSEAPEPGAPAYASRAIPSEPIFDCGHSAHLNIHPLVAPRSLNRCWISIDFSQPVGKPGSETNCYKLCHVEAAIFTSA